jgi:ribosome biogenesis GTPase A
MKLFDYSNVKLNWFPGHMATGLKQIRSRLQSNEINLIIEVRDARIPISSAMTIKDEVTDNVGRIQVFTKRDLADPASTSIIKSNFPNGLLYCKDSKRDHQALKSLISDHFNVKSSNPFAKNRVMVLGIPNVGKSTVINNLKGSKSVKVGNLAGVTRSLSELVCISRSPSLIYLIDTPGILPPRIKNVEEGLKVALCGGLYDKTVGYFLLAEYLLHNLNQRCNREFLNFYEFDSKSLNSIDNLSSFLPLAAKRIGALRPGGDYDLERAAAYFVKQFRLGKFGPITLDNL